jgi:hypothetical protein
VTTDPKGQPREAHRELFLPRRRTDELLRERLAEAVEELNATDEPVSRAEIFAEVTRLRAVLGIGNGGRV